MLRMISEKRALKVVGGYYEMLSMTGYVSHKTQRSLMFYLFFLDLVEYMHSYISEKDYKTIDKALTRLFANGGCLFDYPLFCTLRATLKSDRAILSKNKSFIGYEVRLTENVINKPVSDENVLTVTV